MKRTNKRTNERTNENKTDRTNQRTNQRTNEPTNQRTNERPDEPSHRLFVATTAHSHDDDEEEDDDVLRCRIALYLSVPPFVGLVGYYSVRTCGKCCGCCHGCCSGSSDKKLQLCSCGLNKLPPEHVVPVTTANCEVYRGHRSEPEWGFLCDGGGPLCVPSPISVVASNTFRLFSANSHES